MLDEQGTVESKKYMSLLYYTIPLEKGVDKY